MMTAPFTRRAVLGGVLVAALAPRLTHAQPAGAEPRRLVLRPGSAALRGPAAGPTAIWGFDGTVPGPVLRVRRGGEVWVRAVNELPEPTAIHWHGVRLANPMDGVPRLTQDPIAPGATFDYRFACPDAGTFWYHPPASSAGQIGRGLAGVLIVEADEPAAVDHDLVLLLQDWHLGEAGDIDATADGPGPHLTVNGQPAADIAVRAHDRVRLRLVNAAARVATLALEGLSPFAVAVDGQPSEVIELGRRAVVLPPGGRVDLVVDIPPAGGEPPGLRLRGAEADQVLARFVVDPGPPSRPEPLGAVAALPTNPLPRRIELARAHRAELVVAGDGAPGAGLAGPPLFSVPRGRAVVLALANRDATPRVVHLHGHHVRLLDGLDDGWKPWWHDTVLVAGEKTARLAFIADNPGKWLIEAQALEPQAADLAAWFEVT